MLKYLAFCLSLAGVVPLSSTRHAPLLRDHPDFAARWTVVEPINRLYLGSGFAPTRIAEVDITTAGTVTLEYLAASFTAERSIVLGVAPSENSLSVTFAPGMTGGAPKSIVSAVSHANWSKDKLHVVTTITFPDGSSPEEAKLLGSKTRTVDVRDVLSLGSDGRLLVDTQTSSGGGTMHSIFTRAANEGDPSSFRALAAQLMAVPETRAPERAWLGGYRFGMTPDEVRHVDACPARDYRASPVPPPRDITLLCRRFPFTGLEVQAIFGFEHNGLTSIWLQEPVASEKDARRATDQLLSYLNHESGDLRSLELGSIPVTASAVWDNLDHQQYDGPRQIRRVTVTTANAWPVVLVADIRKDANVIWLWVRHSS